MSINVDLNEVQKKLDKVGKGFCTAKWLQVTMYLQNGYNHSCHHPHVHKINLEEVKENPLALHNTFYKKRVRRSMLKGNKPKECEYCWKIEDLETDEPSDRLYKSASDWSVDKIEEISKSNWMEDVSPTYLEVSFSNLCNFACAYCFPEVSSSIWAESEKFGPYPTSIPANDLEVRKNLKMQPYKHNEENPYIDAFWKWFPLAYKELRVFRITGGEPLLSKDTFKVLDFLYENPNPNLELAINSNLCIPSKRYQDFIKRVQQLVDENKIKKFDLFTSVDTYGTDSEYIRHGLDFDLFMKNLELFLNSTRSNVTIMTTFNILSIPNFDKLLLEVNDLNKKFYLEDKPKRLTLDISYLRNPSYLSVNNINNPLIQKIKADVDLMTTLKQDNGKWWGYSDLEISKLKRILEWVKSEASDNVEKIDFYKFITEYDRRKNKDFATSFPTLLPFLNHCKALMQHQQSHKESNQLESISSQS